MSSLQLQISLCSRMMLMQQFIFLRLPFVSQIGNTEECRGGSSPTVTLKHLIPANPGLYGGHVIGGHSMRHSLW